MTCSGEPACECPVCRRSSADTPAFGVPATHVAFLRGKVAGLTEVVQRLHVEVVDLCGRLWDSRRAQDELTTERDHFAAERNAAYLTGFDDARDQCIELAMQASQRRPGQVDLTATNLALAFRSIEPRITP